MDVRDGDAIAAFQRGDLNRARKLVQEQLAAEAGAPSLQHLMGLIECRVGQLESGIVWLWRASDAAPDNVAYRVMLARALIDSGRFSDALDVAQPPAGTSPPEMALWHARAEASSAVEAWPQAAEAWRMVCSARAGDWHAWSNFGDALGPIGRWPEAVSALQRAVALNPTGLELRRNFAGALNNAGRFEESAEEFRQCVNRAPGDKSLRISRAAILVELGRDKDAQGELDRAAQLAGEPEAREDGVGLLRIVTDDSDAIDVASLRELADLLERTNRIGALRKLLDDAKCHGVVLEEIGFSAAAAELRLGNPHEARRLLLTEDSGPSPLRWHWLMARIEDALGNSEAAFAAAEAMNRSFQNYDQWRTEGAEQRRSVRRLAQAITPSWGARLTQLKPGERADPSFVVGFPRSGTTLLDTFLRGHSETVVIEELPLIRAAESAIGDMVDLPQRSTDELSSARDAYFAELERNMGSFTPGLLIDKLPLNLLAVPLIHSLFPRARIMFARRHPCDVVLSCFMQAFALNSSMASFLDIEDAADFYDAAMTVWARSREALRVPVHTVVYEELVADPEAALRPAIEFLGLDWRPELLDHQTTARSRSRINTPSYNQVTQPLSRAPSGRWRRYEKQLAPVLPILLPWAERLGYRA